MKREGKVWQKRRSLHFYQRMAKQPSMQSNGFRKMESMRQFTDHTWHDRVCGALQTICWIPDREWLYGGGTWPFRTWGFRCIQRWLGIFLRKIRVTRWSQTCMHCADDPENPGVPYFMMGHSMGSYMLRKYLTIHNDDLRGQSLWEPVVSWTIRPNLESTCANSWQNFGWHHRNKLVESLSFGGPYKKYDLSGKTLSNSWLTKMRIL